MQQINVNQEDTDFLAWTRSELESHHFWVPQAGLEGQTKLQANLRKLDFHRHIEQGKGQRLQSRPESQYVVSKLSSCVGELTSLWGYTDIGAVLTDVSKDCIFAVWTKGSFHTHSILSPCLKPGRERQDSHEGNRRAVEIKKGFERLEGGQSCREAASKYSDKQVQRAETWVCNMSPSKTNCRTTKFFVNHCYCLTKCTQLILKKTSQAACNYFGHWGSHNKVICEKT